MSAVAATNSSHLRASPAHRPVHHAWRSRVPEALCSVYGAPLRAASSRPSARSPSTRP